MRKNIVEYSQNISKHAAIVWEHTSDKRGKKLIYRGDLEEIDQFSQNFQLVETYKEPCNLDQPPILLIKTFTFLIEIFSAYSIYLS